MPDIIDWETVAAVAGALLLGPRPVLDEWRGTQWSVVCTTAPWVALVGWTHTKIRYRRGDLELDIHAWGRPEDVAAEVARTLADARSAW